MQDFYQAANDNPTETVIWLDLDDTLFHNEESRSSKPKYFNQHVREPTEYRKIHYRKEIVDALNTYVNNGGTVKIITHGRYTRYTIKEIFKEIGIAEILTESLDEGTTFFNRKTLKKKGDAYDKPYDKRAKGCKAKFIEAQELHEQKQRCMIYESFIDGKGTNFHEYKESDSLISKHILFIDNKENNFKEGDFEHDKPIPTEANNITYTPFLVGKYTSSCFPSKILSLSSKGSLLEIKKNHFEIIKNMTERLIIKLRSSSEETQTNQQCLTKIQQHLRLFSKNSTLTHHRYKITYKNKSQFHDTLLKIQQVVDQIEINTGTTKGEPISYTSSRDTSNNNFFSSLFKTSNHTTPFDSLQQDLSKIKYHGTRLIETKKANPSDPQQNCSCPQRS